MKEQMTFESSSKIENPPSPYNKIMGTIEILLKDYSGGDKKSFLTDKMSELYGNELALEIIEAFPDEFFEDTEKPTIEINEENEDQEDNEQQEDQEDDEEDEPKEIPEVVKPIEVIPEEKKEEVILDMVEKKYKIPKEKIETIKKNKGLRHLLITFSTIAGVSIFSILNKDEWNVKSINNNEIIKEKEKEIPVEKETIKNPEASIDFNSRFDSDVYNSLSKNGKEVYKCFAEKDPTPGRYYQIFDKKNATMYNMGPNNTIIDKFPGGFGKKAGDEPTSPIESGVEVNTTPAGIYAISSRIEPSDTLEYGQSLFSLFGVSVRGEQVFIAEHEIYKGRGEEKKRKKAIRSKSIKDNKFSDGCINIEGFDEKIKQYYKGDYGELLIVLPDEESEKSGVVFDINYLLEQISPLILEMTLRDEKDYENIMIEARDSMSKLTLEIANLEAEKGNLIKELKKNPEAVTKTKKVEEIKQQIKDKKDEISEIRKILGKVDKILEEVKNRRKKIEERLNIV